MRKRRRWTSVLLIVGVLGCLVFVGYLSTCTEVSYFVQLNKFDGSRSPRELARFASSTGCSQTEPDIPECETIHVGIVCAGFDSAARTSTLVKSLLYHRRHPLHLHLVVDNSSHLVLERLFETWQLPAVAVSLYDSEAVVEQVSWIPNRHYSGIYGLLKLTLPDVLPTDLDKVLLVDTDTLFVSDVAQIWKHWRHMDERQALGLVENLSDWYLDKDGGRRVPWPALDRGFNTGVMLMDLGKLRSFGWSQQWRRVAKEQLKRLGATQLADQDIINAVIEGQPDRVYRLPCEWNLQMGFRSLQYLCRAKIADLKIVHWNSPEKTKTRNRYAEFFRRHFQTFLEMDGSLLRKEMLRCSNVSTEATESADAYEYDDDEDGCGEVRRARSTLYRTHLFIRTFSMEERPADVTLVTQLSMDRLQMLEQLLSQWEGPVSVALYLSDSETNQLLRFAADSPHIAHRTNVAFHIVYKQGSLYPVNYLRNVALNASMTPFVYLADVDFLPMFGLYDVLRQAVVAQGSMQNKAMVVPAFEAHGYRSPFPRSKAELINQLDAGRLIVFRQDVWAKGHVPTDYDRWRSAAAPYSVGWQPDYEPYVVVGRHVPKYDPRFLGFGWNKVSHIMLLDALGYDFVVLPNAFIVHQPHAPSFEIAKYRSSPVYRRCLKALKGEFVRDLAKMQNARRRAGRIVPAFDNNATESLFIASDTVIRNRRSNRRR